MSVFDGDRRAGVGAGAGTLVVAREAERHSLTLVRDLAEVGRARHFVSALAEKAGFPETRCYDIALTTSEACANAIEHSPEGGEVSLDVLLYPDRLEVHVGGPGDFQLPGMARERQHRGLGLPLMAALSDHFTLYSRPEGGTLTQLTFYRPDHAGPAPETPLPPGLLRLVETSERLEALLDALPGVFAVVDAEGRLAYVNAEAAAEGRRPKGELIGRRLEEVRPELAEAGLLRTFERAKRLGIPVRQDLHDPTADTWTEVTAFPFGDGVAYFRLPITSRKRTEEALNTCEERLRLALRVTGMAVWDLDLRTDVATRSPRHDEIWGFSEPQAEWGREIAMSHVLPEERPRVEEAYARAFQTGVLSHENRIVWPDGSIHWIRVDGRVYYDDQGCPLRVAGVVADTTEAHRAPS